MKAPFRFAVAFLLAAWSGGAAPVANASQPPGRIEFVRPALTGRVVDNANLLTPEQEARLTGRLAALERRTTDQLIVVTLPSLGGLTIEAVGLDLGNGWRIGQRGKDNGVLLIVAPNERRVRIEVGYGLEAILTDARAAAIIEAIVPAFHHGRFPEGIEVGTQAIVATLVAHQGEPRRRQR